MKGQNTLSFLHTTRCDISKGMLAILQLHKCGDIFRESGKGSYSPMFHKYDGTII